MRILWPVYQVYTEHNQYPGIMNISAVLKHHGFQAEVVDARHQALASTLDPAIPTVLAYSTPTCYAHHYLKLNGAIKKDFPWVFSVFGGPHPTYFPEIVNEEGVDGVCVGEGEYAMLDLVTTLSQGRSPEAIPNWWIRRGDVLYRNPVRPLLDNLDELPIPDHGLFRRSVPYPVSQAVVLTSRGCPHRCTYCFNHVFHELYRGHGRLIRRRSVDHVMAELRELKAASCEYIRFMDDLFILSSEWIAEFAPKYRAQIGLPFSCLVRANYVTDEIIRNLKEAGCFRILMSVEAGNDYLRNNVLKRNMDRETIIEAAALIKKHGIRLVTANILAIPEGSSAADWETLEVNIRCRPDYASVSIMHPYPKTEIFKHALSKNLLDDSKIGEIEASFGFPLYTSLRFPDEREKRRMNNLHKFFSLVVKFPWLAPVVKRLIDLPSNRVFDWIYVFSYQYGSYVQSVPPRIGLRLLLKRTKPYLWLKRRQSKAREGSLRGPKP